MPIKSSKRIIISTSALNSQGFRVMTDGIDLTGFEKNPLMLFNHTRPEGNSKDQILPIGHWEDIEVNGDEISGVPVFDDKDDFAMSIYNKVEGGHIRMSSAGLEPKEMSDADNLLLPGQERPTVTKSVLKEASIVDIGANPTALDVALYDTSDKVIRLTSETFNTILPKIQKTTMKRKPSAAEIAAAKKTIALADKTNHGYVASKAPKATELAAAKAIIKLADDPDATDATKEDDEDPTLLGDDAPTDVDINADPADLTDDQKDALIIQLQKMVNAQAKSLSDMQDEKQQLAADADNAKAETLADKAVALRKITLAEKPKYIKLALADYETTKQVIDGMKPMVTLKSQLENDGAAPQTTEDKKVLELSAKTWDELFKQNGALKLLAEKAPDTYKLKFREKFGKDPK